MSLNNIFIYNEYLDNIDIKKVINIFNDFNIIFINKNILRTYAYKDELQYKNNEKLNFNSNNSSSCNSFTIISSDLQKYFSAKKREDLRLSNAFNLLCKIFQPRLCVFGVDSFFLERSLIKKCTQNKILTISFVHSGLGFDINFSSICGTSNYYLCWNNFDKGALVRNGVSKEKIIICGTEKFDSYLNRYNIKKKNLIIIATSQISLFGAHNICSINKYVDDFLNLLNIIRINSNFNFILKMHPSWDHYDFYNLLLKERAPKNFRLCDKNEDINNLISKAYLFINFNAFTSLSIIAIKFNVPILIHTASILPTHKNKFVINKKNFYITNNSSQLFSFFKNLPKYCKSFNKINSDILYSKIIRKEKFCSLYLIKRFIYTRKLRPNLSIISNNSYLSSHSSGILSKLSFVERFTKYGHRSRYDCNVLYLYGLLGCKSKLKFLFLIIFNILMFPILFIRIFHSNTKLKRLYLFKILGNQF